LLQEAQQQDTFCMSLTVSGPLISGLGVAQSLSWRTTVLQSLSPIYTPVEVSMHELD